MQKRLRIFSIHFYRLCEAVGDLMPLIALNNVALNNEVRCKIIT